jgi:hypothetical protein
MVEALAGLSAELSSGHLLFQDLLKQHNASMTNSIYMTVMHDK